MTDQAPVSSRHVRLKLQNLADIPERVIERMEIATEITKNDRARTTVERPRTTNPTEHAQWDKEIQQALHYLEGAENTIQLTMGRTFTIEWDGICRPI